MAEQPIFREKSLKRITSPEELSDYLRVTSPSVWLVLAAVILLLAGFLIWSSTASIDSFITGSAQVENGSMRLSFDNGELAQTVKTGMTVRIGETESTISSLGVGEDGALFATGTVNLTDGTYPAKVLLRQTQVLKLLFN